MSCAAINGLATSKCSARSGRYSVCVVRIGIVKIAVRVNRVDIMNVSVVNVYPVHVPVAPVIPGMERFAKAQWKPSYAEADAKSEAEASTEETDRILGKRP
jgi:hypothetical protein